MGGEVGIRGTEGPSQVQAEVGPVIGGGIDEGNGQGGGKAVGAGPGVLRLGLARARASSRLRMASAVSAAIRGFGGGGVYGAHGGQRPVLQGDHIGRWVVLATVQPRAGRFRLGRSRAAVRVKLVKKLDLHARCDYQEDGRRLGEFVCGLVDPKDFCVYGTGCGCVPQKVRLHGIPPLVAANYAVAFVLVERGGRVFGFRTWLRDSWCTAIALYPKL